MGVSVIRLLTAFLSWSIRILNSNPLSIGPKKK